MDLSFLPGVNASLNGMATVLLLAGLVFVRRGRVDAHRRAMLCAFAVSTLFLALYVIHKASRGFESTSFEGEGALRAVYLVILVTHVTLAMAVPVLAIAMIRLGWTGRFDTHRRLARVAWPTWMYVSITGVVIYWMLYRWHPPPP